VVAALLERGHDVVGVARSPVEPRDLPVDLAEKGLIGRLLQSVAPEAVVHCAALADIAPCREHPELARRLNATAAGEVARACVRLGARLVAVSTDQVFDGSRGHWSEADAPAPLHEYGASKLAGEGLVAESCPEAAIVRPGLITGPAPAGRRSATSSLLAALTRGERPRMFTDEVRSPVAVVDVARALAELAELPEASGLLHLGGPDPLSRYELARAEAGAAGLDPESVGAGTRVEAGLAAERPADLSLDSARLVALLGWTPRALA
jgi:dTDP-4-dehydrorhamnose reductase